MVKKVLLLSFLTIGFSSCGGDDISVDSDRCHAITQDGDRCKRKAAEGSIYCWQHQK